LKQLKGISRACRGRRARLQMKATVRHASLQLHGKRLAQSDVHTIANSNGMSDKRIVVFSTNQRSFRGHGGVVRGPASPNMGHKSVQGDLASVVMFVRVGLSARAFELSKLCASLEHSRIGVWSGSVCAISSLGVDLWSLEFIYWKTRRQARTNETTRLTKHP
jgi:hypothetical protein